MYGQKNQIAKAIHEMRINNVQIVITVVAFHKGSSSNASAQIAINPILERTTVIIALFIDITSIRLYRSFKLCASVYFQFFLLLQ